MELYNIKIDVAFTTFGVILSKLFGGFDMIIQVLIIVIIIDIMTGVIGSLYNNKFDSARMKKGFINKVLIFIIIVLGVQLDKLSGQADTFRNLICFFYIANEGLSILENLDKMSFPFPEFIRKMFVQMKEESNEIKESEVK